MRRNLLRPPLITESQPADDNRIKRFDKKLVAYTDVEFPLDLYEHKDIVLDCPPVIMAPTFSKRFKYEEQRWIWHDILEVCGQASQFVFLGYGLQQDDYLTRAAEIGLAAGGGPTRRHSMNNSRSVLRALAFAAVLAARAVVAHDAASGGAAARPESVGQMDALLSGAYRPGAPGAAVLVMKDGMPLLRKGYGLANLELGVPIRPEMVFRIGSITKQF